ncbi:MAG: hypothetical protein KAJ18_03335 [Candidatus Omnitrophica bacterium]|nr:hypothetical protein [Candidatus Omnitrophota bacterium]
MSDQDYKKISSRTAILNSIETDPQTQRWFLFLITQAPVKQQLTNEKKLNSLYAKLKKITCQQNFTYTTFLCILSLGFIFQQPLVLGPGLILAFLCIKIHSAKKQYIAQISAALIDNDFTEQSLEQNTLFQVGEFYSRKHKIPSLVDTIYHLDKISRAAVLFAFILTGPICFATLQVNVLSIILCFYIVNAIAKTSLIYKHLR